MKSLAAILTGISVAALTGGIASAETVWLDQLDLKRATTGWGEPHKNQSVEGHPLTIAGQVYERGFGTHAESVLAVNLNGDARSFTASVGVDDEIDKNPAASLEFLVIGDDKVLWQSGVLHANQAAKECAVDLTGVKHLLLKVSDAGDGEAYDHADWANAKFETGSATTFKVSGDEPLTAVEPYILTPADPATPRINGANVYGVRPGSPFLYTIPATGDRPMTFSAKGLPSGLKLDPQTGHITGSVKKAGEYKVTFRAKNALGKAEKKFRIVVGDQIALTPPMGWNSWNCFAGEVSAERVKIAADAMVKSGLINHGWN
ncbi:MAG TPA: NPCBM/NEW2 domain-containing protein, partial [Verrucomicrobiae bacterium]